MGRVKIVRLFKVFNLTLKFFELQFEIFETFLLLHASFSSNYFTFLWFLQVILTILVKIFIYLERYGNIVHSNGSCLLCLLWLQWGLFIRNLYVWEKVNFSLTSIKASPLGLWNFLPQVRIFPINLWRSTVVVQKMCGSKPLHLPPLATSRITNM